MSINFRDFEESDHYDRQDEWEKQALEIEKGKRIFTVQTRKVCNKWVNEIVSVRSK